MDEKRFSRNRKAARKDIERLFGVVKRRFQILGREIKSWELYDNVNIADTFVILHNIIVRTQQSGDFDDEVGGEHMTMEFMNDDGEAGNEAGENMRRTEVDLQNS